MDFLKKAKAQLAETQNDLAKATQSLGLGDKKEESSSREPQSTNSTPINTPATSVAPSTAGAPKAKLPLAIRKNGLWLLFPPLLVCHKLTGATMIVRDNWESHQQGIEAKLSKLLGVPWKVDIDASYIYQYAQSNYSKDNPGDMIKSYVEGALNSLEKYADNYSDEGKSELNSLASSHTITMDVTTREDIRYTACEIASGSLRILFVKGDLGTNVTDSLDNLSDAINKAGSTGDNTNMDFNAKSSIRNDYEPKIDRVKAKLQKLFALPVLELEPNFEHNYAAIAAWMSHPKNQKPDSYGHRDWQKRIGEFTYEYFYQFAEVCENKGFGDDEMVQEGIQEAVEKNQIALRIVDKLDKGRYNECAVENGVLYIQTTAEFWAINVGDPGYELMNVL
ncbi:MAG: hypothetical protein Q9218_001724 [Villophora microphyllina]